MESSLLYKTWIGTQAKFLLNEHVKLVGKLQYQYQKAKPLAA